MHFCRLSEHSPRVQRHRRTKSDGACTVVLDVSRVMAGSFEEPPTLVRPAGNIPRALLGGQHPRDFGRSGPLLSLDC
jgi:hypothetical protein